MESEEFWRNVNSLIKKLGLSQKALAMKCGFTVRRIESLSTYKRMPKVDEAVIIADALGTDVYQLLGRRIENSHSDVRRNDNLLSNEEASLLEMYADLDEADRRVVLSTLGTLHERYAPFSQQRKSGLSG